jgi:RsiW-degrading membrane proteinase PrsW (M82 family)
MCAISRIIYLGLRMYNLELILVALLPPVLIALYLYLRDKYVKEPLSLILLSYISGWTIVVGILLIHFFLSATSISHQLKQFFMPGTFSGSFFDAFVMAAFLEEGFKFLVFRQLIWKSKYFDEYYDGILYAALISLGFASLENIMYVFDYGFNTGLTRAFTAIPAHTFFGISMGYYFSRAKFNFTHTGYNLFMAFFIPLLLHGIYDLILFELSRMESPGDPFFPYIVGAFWGVMVIMYVLSRKRIKAMLKKDVARE